MSDLFDVSKEIILITGDSATPGRRRIQSRRRSLSTSLRANGSRECAPDDKLREAIHLASPQKNGLLRRFAPRNDGGIGVKWQINSPAFAHLRDNWVPCPIYPKAARCRTLSSSRRGLLGNRNRMKAHHFFVVGLSKQAHLEYDATTTGSKSDMASPTQSWSGTNGRLWKSLLALG
jgi:hypothetical protein